MIGTILNVDLEKKDSIRNQPRNFFFEVQTVEKVDKEFFSDFLEKKLSGALRLNSQLELRNQLYYKFYNSEFFCRMVWEKLKKN